MELVGLWQLDPQYHILDHRHRITGTREMDHLDGNRQDNWSLRLLLDVAQDVLLDESFRVNRLLRETYQVDNCRLHDLHADDSHYFASIRQLLPDY